MAFTFWFLVSCGPDAGLNRQEKFALEAIIDQEKLTLDVLDCNSTTLNLI